MIVENELTQPSLRVEADFNRDEYVPPLQFASETHKPKKALLFGAAASVAILAARRFERRLKPIAVVAAGAMIAFGVWDGLSSVREQAFEEYKPDIYS